MIRKYLLGCFASALVWAALGDVAQGHALWTDPKPRDNRDGWKEGTARFTQPCGIDRRASQTVTAYKTGATLTVKWSETVTHPGCFLVDLSTDDKTFMPLANIKHRTTAPPNPTIANPRLYDAMITLPAGVTCTACTLRVRQIMLGNENAPCPPATLSGPSVYYSCANIVVNESGTLVGQPDGGTPDTGQPADGSTGAGGRGGTGGAAMADSGVVPGSGGAAGSGSGGSVGTGAMGGASTSSGGSSASGGAAGMDEPVRKKGESGGCSHGGSPGDSLGGAMTLSLLLLVGAAAALVRRRRPRRQVTGIPLARSRVACSFVFAPALAPDRAATSRMPACPR